MSREENKKLLDELKINEVWVDGYGAKYVCWNCRHNYHGFMGMADRNDTSFCPGNINYFNQEGYNMNYFYEESEEIKEKSKLIKKIGTFNFVKYE